MSGKHILCKRAARCSASWLIHYVVRLFLLVLSAHALEIHKTMTETESEVSIDSGCANSLQIFASRIRLKINYVTIILAKKRAYICQGLKDRVMKTNSDTVSTLTHIYNHLPRGCSNINKVYHGQRENGP